MDKVKLGDKVRDNISGFEGVAVARTEWHYGSTRITIQPRVDKDGKLPDSGCFDEPQIVVTERKGEVLPVNTGGDTGGPLPFKPKQR